MNDKIKPSPSMLASVPQKVLDNRILIGVDYEVKYLSNKEKSDTKELVLYYAISYYDNDNAIQSVSGYKNYKNIKKNLHAQLKVNFFISNVIYQVVRNNFGKPDTVFILNYKSSTDKTNFARHLSLSNADTAERSFNLRNKREFMLYESVRTEIFKVKKQYEIDNPRELKIISTDASMKSTNRNNNICSAAWYKDDNTFDFAFIKTKSIDEGELYAVLLAVREKQLKKYDLVIYTDSRSAYYNTKNALKGKYNTTGRNYISQLAINKHSKGRNITIKWVKSHSGNFLNEKVDTIALTARRHREIDIQKSTSKERIKEILKTIEK